jgi:hypothetical protein
MVGEGKPSRDPSQKSRGWKHVRIKPPSTSNTLLRRPSVYPPQPSTLTSTSDAPRHPSIYPPAPSPPPPTCTFSSTMAWYSRSAASLAARSLPSFFSSVSHSSPASSRTFLQSSSGFERSLEVHEGLASERLGEGREGGRRRRGEVRAGVGQLRA